MSEHSVRAEPLVTGPHPPQVASVREARHAVEAHLAVLALSADAVEDIGLVVAELAANAVLHARSPFSVVVTAILAEAPEEGGTSAAPAAGPPVRAVRVGVVDASPHVPVFTPPGTTGMSGRGLALVQLLAQEWGVDLRDRGDARGEGKTVWAQLDASRQAAEVEGSVEDLLALWTDEEPPAVSALLPAPRGAGEAASVAAAGPGPAPRAPGLRRVEVPGIPAQALLVAKEHMDDLLRELQLVLLGADEDVRTTAPRDEAAAEQWRATLAVASRLDAAARAFAAARSQVREQVARAVLEGAATVDLVLDLPTTAGLDATAYGRAVEQAARLAGSGALLTTASSLAADAEVRQLYLRSLIEQFDDYDAP